MSGEKNLAKLLSAMSPQLVAGEFVFCTFENAHYGDHADLQPIASFTEREGLTLVIAKATADQQHINYESVFRCITLKIHSSLDAVGLTAAFANKLAEHGISANVIAGYYHDHIFVQSKLAQKAIDALERLSVRL